MKIQEELASIGYQISYKPHPWEKGAAYLELFPIICNEEINEVIEEYDIFLSFTSTALIEASLAGKIAIQIHDVAFNADRFDDLGYSYCIDSSDIENSLIGFLDQEPYPIKMDEFYSLAKKYLIYDLPLRAYTYQEYFSLKNMPKIRWIFKNNITLNRDYILT
ncbi:hypothetical protein QNH14_04855 [Apirhabdus apintestini]|nr:hypothetical protein QNH14_04855 [Enterobacteriaceae bacterium CA-0114]